MASIKFKIDKQGKVTAEGQGFQGPVCKEKIEAFLTTAGLGQVTHEEATAEYYIQEQSQDLEINNG